MHSGYDAYKQRKEAFEIYKQLISEGTSPEMAANECTKLQTVFSKKISEVIEQTVTDSLLPVTNSNSNFGSFVADGNEIYFEQHDGGRMLVASFDIQEDLFACLMTYNKFLGDPS